MSTASHVFSSFFEPEGVITSTPFPGRSSNPSRFSSNIAQPIRLANFGFPPGSGSATSSEVKCKTLARGSIKSFSLAPPLVDTSLSSGKMNGL